MAARGTQEPFMALYEAVLGLRDLDECRRFFQDLCTPIELRSMEQRYHTAVCIRSGLPYSEVLERTGASSATVSRVRRSMLEHGAGGVMADVIDRELRNRQDRETGPEDSAAGPGE